MQTTFFSEQDKFRDECGIFGMYRYNEIPAAPFAYYGLFALQHRGQESCGIVINDGKNLQQLRGMGLVSDVFTSGELAQMSGSIAIGHVRYATTGSSSINNAQPFMANSRDGQIAIGHNGNLVNAEALREMLSDEGVVFSSESDTEVIVDLIARNSRNGIIDAIKRVSQVIRGAYSLVMTVGDMLIGIRDPLGIRPLCLGRNDDCWVLSSESCALDAVGAEFVRDVHPGEIIIISKEGLRSEMMPYKAPKKPCIFEHIYFARPDSIIDGLSVYEVRRIAGALLAKKDTDLKADIVIGVPDSGNSAAIGYAQQSGVPYGVGLIKNRYIGRTFIQPLQSMREESVKLKLNPLKETIQGKSVVLVDDSIVRGTTSKQIVDMLRGAGAAQVHFRVSSPTVLYPCHFGIDTPFRKDLIAANMSVEEIRETIGADTLEFLTLGELTETVGGDPLFCRGCFDGVYPIEVPITNEEL